MIEINHVVLSTEALIRVNSARKLALLGREILMAGCHIS